MERLRATGAEDDRSCDDGATVTKKKTTERAKTATGIGGDRRRDSAGGNTVGRKTVRTGGPHRDASLTLFVFFALATHR